MTLMGKSIGKLVNAGRTTSCEFLSIVAPHVIS